MAQLFYVSHHSPQIYVGKTESAGHFGVRNPVSNYQEQLPVGRAMMQLAAVENRASTALATLAVAMAATSAKYFAARCNVGFG